MDPSIAIDWVAHFAQEGIVATASAQAVATPVPSGDWSPSVASSPAAPLDSPADPSAGAPAIGMLRHVANFFERLRGGLGQR